MEKMMKIDLLTLIEEIEKTKVYPDDIRKDDNEFIYRLISFMESNNWFNTAPILDDSNYDNPRIKFDFAKKELLTIVLSQWLSVYGQSFEDQSILLFQFFREKFRKSSIYLYKYYEEKCIDLKYKIEMTEYLLYNLTTDISNYDEDMMKLFVDTLCLNKTIIIGSIICDFFAWCLEKYDVKYKQRFLLNSRSVGKRNTSAYEVETYLHLMYYLFNPDYIKENRTYERIVKSSKSANAFLYLSLHFICAIRDKDLMSLPRPILESDPKEILDSIKNEAFTDLQAKNLVNSILFQLNSLPYEPSKSHNHSGIPDIKFFVPESCKPIIGIYFAAAEAHMRITNIKTRKGLIKITTNPFDMGKSMGDDFFQLFLEENFSSRRANKAYMQGIELYADSLNSNISAPKGYMLAALARSHKGSYNKFAETTEIYLKDSNFSGLTPEFVARELFERGVCSFVPYILLSIIEKDDFSKLSVTKQTHLIKDLGMSPGEIENIITIFEKSKKIAINIINQIINTEKDDFHEKILAIIHNIGSGAAASKQDNVNCLLTAMNKACIDPDRKLCIKCDYSILTKSILFTITAEFKRLKNLIETSNDQRMKNKYKAIIVNIILPTLEEMLECVYEKHGQEGATELEQIIRRYSEK